MNKYRVLALILLFISLPLVIIGIATGYLEFAYLGIISAMSVGFFANMIKEEVTGE